MNPLPVGVIGVGHLGGSHVKKYLDIPESELVGVWDTDENVQRSAPETFGVRMFESLDSLLANVQAVSVVVPSPAHADVAVAAIEKGVHVFVEKPIAHSISEADRIIEAARKHKVKLQVGHIERFNSAFRSLEKITSGEINPRFIESHRLARFSPRGMDVSVVLDLMIHDIDLILQLMSSKIERIDASGVGVVSNTADIVNARLIFADGAAANITASRISQKNMRKMRLFQKDSYISLDFETKEAELFQIANASEEFIDKGMFQLAEIETGEEGPAKKIGAKKYLNDGKDALELELKSFIDSVKHNKPPVVSGIEARSALETALVIAEKIG